MYAPPRMRPPLVERLAEREPWVRAGAAVILGVTACVLGGALRARNLPIDDSYIHLSYGIDFDPRTLFSFQAGRRDTGTSSWVWTSIAILVAQLRLPEYAALTLLSVGIFCALLWVAMGLVARALPRDVPLRPLWPVASALLLAGSGNVLWLSISGMETGLFVLLLLCAVQRALAGRGLTWGAGLLALLLIWTRIEGVIWLGAAAALLPVTGSSSARRQWRGWILPLAGLALYAGYNLSLGGHVLPSSGLSKRVTFIPGGHSWAAEQTFVTQLYHNYLRPFVPGLALEIPAVAAGGVALLGVALARAARRRRLRLDPAVAAVAALVAGAFFHAAVNVVEFRSGYHHLRYFAPLLFLVPLLAPTVVLGAAQVIGRLLARAAALPLAGPAARWGGVAAGALLLGSALLRELKMAPLWATLYLRNAEQLAAVHLAVGRYLRESAPPGTKRVASFDIGALRWASHLEIVDLAGTSDARTLSYQRARRQADSIRDTHAELYISIENGFDYVATTQPTYDLELLRSWQFPEYFDPYPPHSKRMVLYRVNHCGEPRVHRQRAGAAILVRLRPRRRARARRRRHRLRRVLRDVAGHRDGPRAPGGARPGALPLVGREPPARSRRGPLRDGADEGDGRLPLLPHRRRARSPPPARRPPRRGRGGRLVDGLRRGLFPGDRPPHRRPAREDVLARARRRLPGPLGPPDARRDSSSSPGERCRRGPVRGAEAQAGGPGALSSTGAATRLYSAPRAVTTRAIWPRPTSARRTTPTLPLGCPERAATSAAVAWPSARRVSSRRASRSLAEGSGGSGAAGAPAGGSGDRAVGGSASAVVSVGSGAAAATGAAWGRERSGGVRGAGADRGAGARDGRGEEGRGREGTGREGTGREGTGREGTGREGRGEGEATPASSPVMVSSALARCSPSA